MPTALITGPTVGIGNAFAEALARRGYDLVLVARDEKRLKTVAADFTERYRVAVEVLPADLADREQLTTVEERLRSPREGQAHVDLLVNNAGFTLKENIVDSSSDDEERLLDVLVVAVLRLAKAALPGMITRRAGGIINVSSVAGYAPYGTYGAAKIWVTTFTEGLSFDLEGTGVRAVAVCPGYVHTEFHQRAGVQVVAPDFMWIPVEKVVEEALASLFRGTGSPVVIPSPQYKVLMAAAKLAPRNLVLRIARGQREKRA